jgi:hypothetical protein
VRSSCAWLLVGVADSEDGNWPIAAAAICWSEFDGWVERLFEVPEPLWVELVVVKLRIQLALAGD